MQLTRVTSNPCIRQVSRTAQNSTTSVDANNQFPDFKTFLEKSPYAQIKLRKPRNREHSLDERIENERIFNKDLSLQAPTSDLKTNERGFLFAPDQSSVHFDVGNDISPVRILDHTQTYHEFPTIICHPQQIDFNHSRNLSDCLSPSNQEKRSARPQETANEKAMKKLLENMQEQMRKMDLENRKLKKENATLVSQNKKFQIQAASFIVEQESFAKVKNDYEKRLKRLEDFYKSSDEMNATLQQILSLQEDEYYDRIVSKKEPILKSSNTRQNTASFDPKKLVRKQTKQVSIMKSATMLDSTQNTTAAFDRSRSRSNLTEKSNTMIFRKHTLTASINDIITPQKISRPMTAKAKDGSSIHFDFKQALEKV